MIVHQIPVGPMQNFSYIVVDEDTSESIIIDPSWNLMELELIIKNNNLKIKYIVNTHYHDDHTQRKSRNGRFYQSSYYST